MDRELIRQVDSDEWWADRLLKKLNAELPRIRDLQKWAKGEPDLPVPDNVSESYRRLQRVARLNLAEMIINAVLHRMQPLAFRTAAEGDENGDAEARRIMKANDFGVFSDQIIMWMLTFGTAYSMTGRAGAGPDVQPRITAEHPQSTIAEVDPMDRKRVLAAIKIYRDDVTGRDVLVLRRPGYERTFYRQSRATAIPNEERPQQKYPGTGHFESSEEPVPLGIPGCGVRPYSTPSGMGEFEKHIDTLRRINHTIMQRMVIIALQAFRQRGIKGVPNVDEDGKEIDYDDIFSADPGALWILPETADLWESGQADLTPVLSSVKDDLGYLAAVSSTPIYQLFPDAANGSAEGASLQREALIFKTEKLIKWATWPFAADMADLFALKGDSVRADVAEMDVKWMSPKRSSLTERADSGIKAKAAGVPWRMRMEKFLELTPDEIADAERQRADDAFMEVPDAADTGTARTGNEQVVPAS